MRPICISCWIASYEPILAGVYERPTDDCMIMQDCGFIEPLVPFFIKLIQLLGTG